MVDRMLVLLTRSTGPGSTNRDNYGLGTKDTLGGTERLQRSKFMCFLLCLLSAVGAGGAKIDF